MTQVVSFINMKGGVGKTTLAVNVAYSLAYWHGLKVLLVDIDPQFNASTYLMSTEAYLSHIKDDSEKATTFHIFESKRPPTPSIVDGSAKTDSKIRLPLSAYVHSVYHGDGKLDLIPSTLSLMELETSRRGTEQRLQNFLKEKAAGYDYVLLDCPPTISIYTQAAILASDKYLVPLKPDPLSTIGLPLLEKWLDDFIDDAGKRIQKVGIVFCLVRGPLPNQMKFVMDDLRNRRTDEVFQPQLSESTKVAESVEKHLPVFLVDASSKSAKEVIEITQEFLDRTTGV